MFLAHLPLSLLKGFFYHNVNGVALTYRNVCTMIFVRAILPLPNVMYSVFQNVNANLRAFLKNNHYFVCPYVCVL